MTEFFFLPHSNIKILIVALQGFFEWQVETKFIWGCLPCTAPGKEEDTRKHDVVN